MSIRVMSDVWRLKIPQSEKMVLLVIADHASDDGTNAWPSQATIAEKSSCTIRTVQRCVNNLVKSGYLRMEKGAGGSATCRDDRRPHRYTINLGKLRGDKLTTRNESRGVFDDDYEASLETDTGRLSRPMNHPLETPKETPKADDLFEKFWKVYPKKVSKGSARKSWAKITDPEAVIAGAERYASDPNRKQEFTAHPATWLNGERWLDIPDAPHKPQEARRGVFSLDPTPTPTPPRFTAPESRQGVPMPEEVRAIFNQARSRI